MSNHLEKTRVQLEKRYRLSYQSMSDLTYQTLDSGLGICSISVEPHAQMFCDIARLINGFTHQRETQGQMLEKSPDDIRQGFEAKRSIILVHPDYVADGTHQGYLAHAASYPLITFNFPRGKREKVHVIEIGGLIKGTALANIQINGDYTVGETLISLLQRKLEAEHRSNGDIMVLLATVKRDNVESAFWEANMDVVPYERTPLLTHSTCVCSGVSEKSVSDNPPQHSCGYRMQKSEYSTVIPVDQIQEYRNPEFIYPDHTNRCRQVIYKPEGALKLESFLRQQFEMIMGASLNQPDKIDKVVSGQIYEFYSKMGATIYE